MADDTASTTGDSLQPRASSALSSPRLAATGALLGALAASSCCILPLVLFSVGITGAWLGNLAALAPWQPLFVAAGTGFLAYGFYLVRGRRRAATCRNDGACSRAAPNRFTTATLWISALLIAAAAVYPWAAPWLLDT